MPYKQKGSDRWWVGRTYPGIGKLQKSTATTVKADAVQMESMLDRLYSTGKAAFLNDLKKGLFTLPWLYSKDLAGELDTLVSSVTVRPFREVSEWVLKNDDLADESKRSYLSVLRHLDKLYPGSTIYDIPAMLVKFRAACMANGKKRSFNRARTVCQAYARSVEGKHRTLWIAVTNVPRINYDPKTARKLTWEEAMDLTKKLMFGHEDGAYHVEILWSLLLTGMRKSEYLGSWTVYGDRVEVENGKQLQTKATLRYIPRVVTDFVYMMPWPVMGDPNVGVFRYEGPYDPAARFETFERQVRKHTKHLIGDKVTNHSMRHTYRTWCLHAGIPEIRAEAYLGHKVNPGDVKQLYSSHDVIPFLAFDAQLLKTWMKAEWEKWEMLRNPFSGDDGYQDPDDAPELQVITRRIAPPKRKVKLAV